MRPYGLIWDQADELAALRARLVEVERERDAERFRFQALCMASGPDGRCMHGNVNDEARDMLCLWCAREQGLMRERDEARAERQTLAEAAREALGCWVGARDDDAVVTLLRQVARQPQAD